ncbi:hypothetical protein [uncultured Aquimarina sp.]|uniref:hypothetical protein n=1 Tax=uncultured Aquimarina sp. TaxID=575652 RepID=UPI002614236A|nr:hypothetical protein [uncultured Aquimarina sp.]
MKKTLLLILILFVSSISYSQETKKISFDDLKIELENFLVEKNQIRYLEKDSVKIGRLYIGGIHNKLLDKQLKNGIYVFNNNSTHSLSFFVIIENNSYDILDISTLSGLIESAKKVIVFSNKQNYCYEITIDYLSRLIGVHYNINRNPRYIGNKNCKSELKPIKSIFTLNSLKLKLAEFLVEKSEFKNIDYYFKDSYYLGINRTDFYYGMPKENENIDCGIYSFANYEKYEPNIYYVIVNEGGIEIFEMKNEKNLNTLISKILSFGEDQRYCHLKTTQIIKQVFENYDYSSCFINWTKELP